MSGRIFYSVIKGTGLHRANRQDAARLLYKNRSEPPLIPAVTRIYLYNIRLFKKVNIFLNLFKIIFLFQLKNCLFL